jgi:xanthine dehydrogenase molybdopterin-binding subunit B
MFMLGKRNPFLCKYSAGFDDSGKLTAVKMDYIADCGYLAADTVGSMSMALTICDNAYYCPNWLVTPLLVKTNTPFNTACRAPGVCPAVFFIETMMDDIARSLKVSPLAVRTTNLYVKDQITPYKQPLPYCSLPTLWDQALDSMDFAARRANVDAFNRLNRWRKRGIAINPQKYIYLFIYVCVCVRVCACVCEHIAHYSDLSFLFLQHRYGLAWSTATYSVYVAIMGHDGSVVVSHAVGLAQFTVFSWYSFLCE